MSNQYQDQQIAQSVSTKAFGQLSAVKASPIDERIGAIAGSLSSLESEITSLVRQLAPVMLSSPEIGGNSGNVAPSPSECAIEQSLRGFDERIISAWQNLSALRSQLRV